MRHPLLRGVTQALHVAILPGQSHFAQRGGVAVAQARVATHASFGPCAGQTGLRPFADQGALEFGRSAQNLQSELALR